MGLDLKPRYTGPKPGVLLAFAAAIGITAFVTYEIVKPSADQKPVPAQQSATP